MIAMPSFGRLVPTRMVGEIGVTEDLQTARLRERRLTSSSLRGRRPLMMRGGRAFASRPIGLRAGCSSWQEFHPVQSHLDPSSQPGIPDAIVHLAAPPEWFDVSSACMAHRHSTQGMFAVAETLASARNFGRLPSGKGVHAE